MESETLGTRIADLTRSLTSVEVTGDMHPAVCKTIAAHLDSIAADARRDIVPALRASKDTQMRDDAARLFRQLAISNSWLDGRDDRTRDWIDQAAELVSSELLRDLIVAEQNRLRDGEAFAGIFALCRQGLVDKARRELIRRRKATRDPVTRKRIDEILADPRNLIAPMRGAPSMFTYNGFGTMLYGTRAARSDGTHVATLCLVFCFIPFLPLRAYLVRQEGQMWRFFGRVPLSPFAFWWRRCLVMGPVLAALILWGVESWTSSPYVRETRLLSTATEKIERRDYAGAVGSLGSISGTKDSSRAAQVDDLARKALLSALGDVKDVPDAQLFLSTTGTAVVRIRRPPSKEIAPAAEAALGRIAARPNAAKTARDFLSWMARVLPDCAAKQPDLAAQACVVCDDPILLAATADLFVQGGRPCPAAVLSRLSAHLLGARHPTWNADALSYLHAAPASDSRAILHARSEAAWKGVEPGSDLLAVLTLPEPLRRLLTLDGEADPEKRAAGLEKAADPAGLEEPQKTWHRLGSARRLAKACGLLNEKDPLRFPVSKVRPWAIQAAELAPEDPGARVLALRYLLEDGDFARVITLGSPSVEDSRTATLVGIALARSGKAEEAGALLRPLVSRELPEFLGAVQQWEKAVSDKTAAVWHTLEKGTANRSVLTRLNSLSKETASIEADKWVRQQVEQDPWIAQLRTKWRERIDIHPAASELAMIELGLGRSLPPGPDRQARLMAAELLFLDLRKISRDDPHQDLQLGQVYFWLGKDREGTEIFDRLEAAGDPKVLQELGDIYRTLSRMDAARRVLEAAYDKAEGGAKSQIASLRAYATSDSEDRLIWLRKSNTSLPYIRAEIDSAEARLAFASGHYEAAIAPLKGAAAYYAGLPETATSLNNGSIIQHQLAKASGDLKYDLEGLRMVRRAHELIPEDGIVLANYVSDLVEIGISALAGSALRPDLLHESPSQAWMDYVVPGLSPQEWAVRAKLQPELRRAAELGVKSGVLSPDGDIGYNAQIAYLNLTQDAAALRRLRESLESKPPVRQEEATQDDAHARGEYSENERKMMERGIARWEGMIAGIRKAGHAPTLAYALKNLAASRFGALRIGLGGQKMETIVREAEEAAAVFDAPPTRQSLAWFQAEQGVREYSASDEDFGGWMKGNPSLNGGDLLALYVRKHPERAAGVRQHAGLRRATQAIAAVVGSENKNLPVWIWAWLEMMGHESREAARKALESDPTLAEWHQIRRLLNPHSAGGAVNAWLAAIALGDKGLAAKFAAQAREAGLVPQFFKD